MRLYSRYLLTTMKLLVGIKTYLHTNMKLFSKYLHTNMKLLVGHEDFRRYLHTTMKIFSWSRPTYNHESFHYVPKYQQPQSFLVGTSKRYGPRLAHAMSPGITKITTVRKTTLLLEYSEHHTYSISLSYSISDSNTVSGY